MLPFRVSAAVVCDDIRQEVSNKFILIGVYNGTLVSPGFPFDGILTWWLQIFPEKVGAFEIDIQMVKDDAIVRRGRIGMEIKELEWSSIIIPKLPIQIQSVGTLKLQLKIPDEGDWQTVHELDVKQGEVVGASELLIPIPIR